MVTPSVVSCNGPVYTEQYSNKDSELAKMFIDIEKDKKTAWDLYNDVLEKIKNKDSKVIDNKGNIIEEQYAASVKDEKVALIDNPKKDKLSEKNKRFYIRVDYNKTFTEKEGKAIKIASAWVSWAILNS